MCWATGKLKGLVVPLSISFVITASHAVGQSERLGVVVEFSEGIKANRKRISTWEGVARVYGSELSATPDSPGEKSRFHYSAQVRFWRDNIGNRVRYDWDDRSDELDGVVEENARLESDGSLRGILSGDRFIEYWRDRVKSVNFDGRLWNTTIVTLDDRESFERKTSRYYQWFDPNHALLVQGDPAESRLDRLIEDERWLKRYDIEIDGSLLTLKMESDTSYEVTVYDRDQGYNVIEHTTASKDQTGFGHKVQITYSYTQTPDGIWAPKEVIQQYWNTNEDPDAPILERREVFDLQQFNSPIDDSRFEMASIDIKEDAFVEDKVVGLTYPYRGMSLLKTRPGGEILDLTAIRDDVGENELPREEAEIAGREVPVSSSLPPIQDSQQTNRRYQAWLTIAGSFFLVVIIWTVWKKFR